MTYAAAVAAVSLGATVALASSADHSPAAPHAKQAASISPRRMQEVAERVARLQRSDGAAVPGVSERELRTLETATLGPQHAAEHASNRAAERANPAAQRAAYRAASAPVKSAAAAAPASQVGKWSTPFDIPTFGIHAALLPTGKVMYFSYQTFAQGGDAQRNTTQAWLWDPTKGTGSSAFNRVDPPPNERGDGKPENIWCAGHTFTADGQLVVFGGNLSLPTSTSDYKGLNRVFTFDPYTEKWTVQPKMRHGRWYPSGVRMPDGTIPILSGLDENGGEGTANHQGQLNDDIELFTPAAERGGQGSISLIGQTSLDPSRAGIDPPEGEYYPHLFSMASGRMLVAGPENTRDRWFMDSHTPFAWSRADGMSTRRLWGNAVPIATDDTGPHKVMALGGVGYFSGSVSTPFASTEIFDEDDDTGDDGEGLWKPASNLNIGRAHANAVLLPDGSMAEVGGGIGTNTDTTNDAAGNGGQYTSNPDQKQVELWNPSTGKWTLGPAQTYPRAYHSTALLLPDGRVVSAGDDRLAKRQSGDTAEIYEPPYLNTGRPRPVIQSAPQSAVLGSSFDVSYSGEVTRAALVAPSATTHAVDMNQRYLPLQVSASNGTATIKAPPTANAAPPGYYMLFLLDSKGVPSVAKFVRLTTTPDPVPPTDPGTGTGTDGGGGSGGSGSGTVTVPPRTPITPSTTSAPKPTTTIRLRVSSAPATKGRLLHAIRRRVAIRCRATATAETRTCKVVLRERLSRKRTRVIGSATATIRRGKSETRVSIALSSAALHTLAARGSLSVWADLRVTVRGARGVVKARQAYRLVN